MDSGASMNYKVIFFYKIIVVFFLSFSSSLVYANIVITGTRVVFPGNDKEVTVKLNNKGDGPVLIQAWIDSGDFYASPDSINVPFVITPPLNRVDQGKGQTLRISKTKTSGLKSDRESLFWLNILEISPNNIKNKQLNKLQIGFRTRIKFFYRPPDLNNNSTKAAESLKWQSHAGNLIVTNQSPYFISLLGVRTDDGKNMGNADMIEPFGQYEVKAKYGRFSSGQKITWQYINDWGAIKKSGGILQ